MLKSAFLFFHTAKHLKFIQIKNRIKRKFVRPKIKLFRAPEKSRITNKLINPIKCEQKFNGAVFEFLNKKGAVQGPEEWNPDDQGKLWIYNLHYFDDLNAKNSKQRTVHHVKLIQKWIVDNPPGFKNGWEPYPSSLRIVNWIKWLLLNRDLKQEWLDSLAIQTRFLSQNLEFHLLGNHLFANAKALIFSGLFFQGSEATKWYQAGMDILNRELTEQVLPDGGNFELSPMYHAIFVEDLLDLINIHRVYNKKKPAHIAVKVTKMIKWLECMSHPDGEISFFNDATLGQAPSITQLLAYSKRLGIDYKRNKLKKFLYLKESGYIRFKNNNLLVIADVAKIGPDYLPGHGHADALSFEMSLFGKRLIVNSGISTYEKNSERQLQRGTLSHSTITVDGVNSSQVWNGFRVAKRAKVFDIRSTKISDNFKFSACHNGYEKYTRKILHCREWNISKNSLVIVDNIIGKGMHEVSSVLPLHPEVEVSDLEDNSAILLCNEKKVKINFKGEGLLQVVSSKYHPEFGLSVDNKKLLYSYTGYLPFKITINISW